MQKFCKGRPCGKLAVVLRDGRKRALPDVARGVGAAPVAVSGDGTRVAYVRARDRAVVAYRLGGGVRVMKGVKQPKEVVGADATRLVLSRDGRLLAYVTEDLDTRVDVFDTGTGRRVGSSRSGNEEKFFAGFGDDEALVVQRAGDTFDVLVTDLRGRVLRRDTPPQVVGFNLPDTEPSDKVAALSPDGRTLATYVPGEEPGLAIYDVISKQIARRIPLQRGYRPAAMTWTGPGEVMLRIGSDRMAGRVRVDVASGSTEIADTYAIPRGVHPYHAGG
ncbi:hypothetical protein ABT294_13275 [Nonomuraea sp. NPDC000554]|uniref:hypothetical protein n=1 Tax=Nonomuraea sp. NPDC000554 TaxID=3154259 RepID=UPI003320A8DC